MSKSDEKDIFRDEFNKLFMAVFGGIDEDLSDDEYNLREQVCANIIMKVESSEIFKMGDFTIKDANKPVRAFHYQNTIALYNAQVALSHSGLGPAIDVVKDVLEKKAKNRRTCALAQALLGRSGLQATHHVQNDADEGVVGTEMGEDNMISARSAIAILKCRVKHLPKQRPILDRLGGQNARHVLF